MSKTQPKENHHYLAVSQLNWGKYLTRKEAEDMLKRDAATLKGRTPPHIRDSYGIFGRHMLCRIALPIDIFYQVPRDGMPRFLQTTKPDESWKKETGGNGLVEILSVGGRDLLRHPSPPPPSNSRIYFYTGWGGRFVTNNPKPKKKA